MSIECRSTERRNGKLSISLVVFLSFECFLAQIDSICLSLASICGVTHAVSACTSKSHCYRSAAASASFPFFTIVNSLCCMLVCLTIRLRALPTRLFFRLVLLFITFRSFSCHFVSFVSSMFFYSFQLAPSAK